MLDLFREIFSGDFLLKHALWTVLTLGVVTPLAGCFLLLRRATFLGVALPQVSATGMAGGWLLLEVGGRCLDTVSATEPRASGGNGAFSLLCALTATLAVLLLLAWLEYRGNGASDSRHGVLYALAAAATMLLLAFHPHAEHSFSGLLSGEIVSIGRGDFWLVAAVLIPVAVVLGVFRHEFLWAGADPAFMMAAGRRVFLWNALLLGTIGAVISATVYVAGPLVCLGSMLLPALAAHRIAPNMNAFFVFVPFFGLAGSLVGFAIAYRMDLPTGVTIVAAHGVILVLTNLAVRMFHAKRL
jgi:zinc transport system permease protein